MFRNLRILFLLLILFGVAMSTWLSKLRATDWSRTQWLVVYPINGDGSNATASYIRDLNADRFRSIEEFLAREAEHYGLPNTKLLEVQLAPEVQALPPQPPQDRQVFKVMLWSLQMRWWAWRNDSFNGPGNMKMYVVYHDPQMSERLDHSFGLEKGLVGVAHAFADARQAEGNNVIIAHELLHMVGASDKYDLASNQPFYPIGYAEPERVPLYPQQYAEIMGGRIPLSEREAEIPRHLLGVLVGEHTAREIRWIK